MSGGRRRRCRRRPRVWPWPAPPPSARRPASGRGPAAPGADRRRARERRQAVGGTRGCGGGAEAVVEVHRSDMCSWKQSVLRRRVRRRDTSLKSSWMTAPRGKRVPGARCRPGSAAAASSDSERAHARRTGDAFGHGRNIDRAIAESAWFSRRQRGSHAC
jgi:hypothetical protein